MKSLLFVLFVSVLISGCGSGPHAQSQEAGVRNQESGVSSNAGAEPQASALRTQIKEMATEAKGRVAVSAFLLETGEGVALLNPQERFPMQSVYKLPISMAVMKLVDAGKLKLTDKITIGKNDMVGRAAHSPIRNRFPNGTTLTVDEILRYALSESDGTASDVLMKLAGGPAAVQAYLTQLGIKDMIVLDTEQELSQDHSLQYRNYTTPEAAVALLRVLHERRGLSESSHALLLKDLIESKPGANRLKGLLPAGTVVAHKTGTSGTEKGITAATNDIGIITLPNGKHLAIAVFVADSPADQATREGVIAKIARAVYGAVTGDR